MTSWRDRLFDGAPEKVEGESKRETIARWHIYLFDRAVQYVFVTLLPWTDRSVTNVGPRARECSSADLHPALRSALERRMLTDEEIDVCFESTLVSEFDRRQEYIYAHLITDRRAISAACGVRTVHGHVDIDPATVSSIYLTDIASVDHYPNLLPGTHQVWLRGHAASVGLDFGSREAAERFIGILQRAMDETRQAPGRPPGAVADRLQELTALHSQGLVSEDEFQQKRKELLDQL